MSKIKKIQTLFPDIQNEGDIRTYLNKVLVKVEENYKCKIHTWFNKNSEYGMGWSYRIEKEERSSTKWGNGDKEHNLVSAILSAVEL
jgi:hypothetical protein